MRSRRSDGRHVVGSVRALLSIFGIRCEHRQLWDKPTIVHLERGRYNFPDLLRKAKELAERYKPSEILVEDASTGIVLAQELPKILRVPVKAVPVERDKISRLYLQQAKFEAGHVHFPRGASFLPELEAELFAFPRGKHDDQVDALSQLMTWYERPKHTCSILPLRW